MRTHYGPWQPCWISNQHQKHNSGRGPSSEHFWQVWLISVQRFQRRRFKCEKLTDAYPWQKLTWPMARWAKNAYLTITCTFLNLKNFLHKTTINVKMYIKFFWSKIYIFYGCILLWYHFNKNILLISFSSCTMTKVEVLRSASLQDEDGWRSYEKIFSILHRPRLDESTLLYLKPI
jgi:hypothetical protein